MIEEKTKKVFVVEGQEFTTCEGAKKFALTALLAGQLGGPDVAPNDHEKKIIDRIMSNTSEVIAILTNAKPKKPRSDRGKNHRKRGEATGETVAA